MNANTLSRRWLQLAVVYFALGVGLGVAMGASGDHTLFTLHAHINLLGWVSMTLFGLIGAVFPAVTSGRIASTQFWIHNLALPVMLVALAAKLKGHAEAEPILGVGATAVGVGVLLFAFQVLRVMRSPVPRVVADEQLKPLST
jgi:hypothetical protein